MGGQNSQVQNTSATSQPWAPAQGALQGILGSLAPLTGNASLSPAEQSALILASALGAAGVVARRPGLEPLDRIRPSAEWLLREVAAGRSHALVGHLPFLGRLAAWTTARRRIAGLYHKRLADVGLDLPTEAAKARHVYHLFTVRHPQRDALAKLLTDEGISTAVYYPRSVPDQPMFGGGADRRWPEAWRASREVLSLPCFAELSDDEVERVVAGVRRACERL